MSDMNPANYEFLCDQAVKRSTVDHPFILDYGCGYGAVVKYGLGRGLNVVGCDPYEGYYESWYESEIELKDHLKKMKNGLIPYGDGTFDVVVSNQVFEHTPDYKSCFHEIERVLKPGGVFITTFSPLRETFYEGHARLYFVHHLQNFSKLQLLYLKFCHALGFGRKSEEERHLKSGWPEKMQKVLQDVCFYHSYKRVLSDVKDVFHADSENLAAIYIRFRGRKLGLDRAPKIMDALFSELHKRRAGITFAVSKANLPKNS